MRFVIWTPPYSDRSAGIAALHRLCHWLNVLGHDAAVTSTPNPDWEEQLHHGAVGPDVVAVYPEIVPDNPLGARRVARWALSHPGFKYFQSPVPMGPADAYFCYADRFRTSTEAAVSNYLDSRPVQRLFVSVYPRDMFFPGEFARTKTVVYVGRGQDTYDAFAAGVDVPQPAEMWPGGFATRYEVGRYLRRVKLFYCFDQVCALALEAFMCGCTVIQVQDDGMARTVNHNGYDDPLMDAWRPGNAFDEPCEVQRLIAAFA